MKLDKLWKEIGIEKDGFKDLHVTRMYSSFIAVSEGKIIRITEPFLEYCPLADALYKKTFLHEGIGSDSSLTKAIKKAVEEKISKYGYFTAGRELQRKDIVVPYGASEIMMYALRKKRIDSAVVVCDGVGTVVVDRPEIVQGIGARMNGLFYTSPVPETIEKLRGANCHVASPEAEIEQVKGLEKAAELGYKDIAVTISGYIGDELSKIEEARRKHNISVTTMVVCTTGATEERIREIGKHGDIVWSCASEGIRKIVGRKSVLQVSTGIPVFVLTKKGLDLIAAYSSDENLIKNLDLEKQHLLSGKHRGEKMEMGNFSTYLSEAKLPVRSREEPWPLA